MLSLECPKHSDNLRVPLLRICRDFFPWCNSCGGLCRSLCRFPLCCRQRKAPVSVVPPPCRVEHHTRLPAEDWLAAAAAGIVFAATAQRRLGRLVLVLLLLKGVQSAASAQAAPQRAHGEFPLVPALRGKVPLALHPPQPHQEVSRAWLGPLDSRAVVIRGARRFL